MWTHPNRNQLDTFLSCFYQCGGQAFNAVTVCIRYTTKNLMHIFVITFSGQAEMSLSSQLFKYDMDYQLGFFKPPGRWNNSLLVRSVQTIGAERLCWLNPTKIWSGERSVNPTAAPTAAAAAAVSKHCGECKQVNVFIQNTCGHSCNQGIWVKLKNWHNNKPIYFASFLNLTHLEQFYHLFIKHCNIIIVDHLK